MMTMLSEGAKMITGCDGTNAEAARIRSDGSTWLAGLETLRVALRWTLSRTR